MVATAPSWSWSGPMGSASDVTSCSAIRNRGSCNSSAVVCGILLGSIGGCWWSRSLSWSAICKGYAVSLAGERRRVDSHWKSSLGFARIGLHWLQQSVIAVGRALLAWMPIPLQALEPCVPTRGQGLLRVNQSSGPETVLASPAVPEGLGCHGPERPGLR